MSLALLQLSLNLSAHLIGQLADNRSFLSGKFSHLFEDCGQFSFFSQIFYSNSIQRLETIRPLKLVKCFFLDCFQCSFHAISILSCCFILSPTKGQEQNDRIKKAFRPRRCIKNSVKDEKHCCVPRYHPNSGDLPATHCADNGALRFPLFTVHQVQGNRSQAKLRTLFPQAAFSRWRTLSEKGILQCVTLPVLCVFLCD